MTCKWGIRWSTSGGGHTVPFGSAGISGTGAQCTGGELSVCVEAARLDTKMKRKEIGRHSHVVIKSNFLTQRENVEHLVVFAAGRIGCSVEVLQQCVLKPH